MQDVVATPGSAATIRGKFAYGVVSKDLEGEDVRVFLDDCAGWKSLGDFRTDGDGRISAPVPTALGAGVYEVRLEVLGDASVAPGRLWILPIGTHLAVTDVDGTLTTGDEELVEDVIADLFGPIFSGDRVPEAYPASAELTDALVGRGYVLVYLTGRPYWLTAKTRDWLAAGGFAAGPLHVADSNGEALPLEAAVGAYKRDYLESLAAQGFILDEAYGNAATDVYAYAAAGIAPGTTWIIGPNGGSGGTNAVSGSWQTRADTVAGEPPVEEIPDLY
jgi:phosphatidate phosphatase PAH1